MQVGSFETLCSANQKAILFGRNKSGTVEDKVLIGSYWIQAAGMVVVTRETRTYPIYGNDGSHSDFTLKAS
ncbi:hypothetical protein M0802_003420 [Mischocyttarus mexicanus]|nr:hypothetical protein M0802_003420 [Mischocyttarus mexicanus]